MINGIKNILTDFVKRGGIAIFLSSFLARILSFIASLIALYLIDDAKLGLVIYAFSIISFIIPIGGLGLHQGLIRYGALLESDVQKNSLFVYVLKKGVIWSLVLSLLIIGASFLFEVVLLESQEYLILLSFVIPTTFILEIIKIQLRLFHRNVAFAQVEITHAIIFVISVFLLSYFYKEVGYSIALIITPLITSFIFFNKLNISAIPKVKLAITNITFWKYGFYSSLSNVATQFLMAIDILLIGYFLSNTETVTIYKYISLIPLSLLFLSRVFMTNDFVKITENIFEKNYLKNYIKNYMLVFTIISGMILLFSALFSTYILALFGTNFIEYDTTFMILIVGICGILIFRGLFGNLLSAIGKSYTNYWIALIAIVINIISNYYLIPKYGLIGAAITSAVLMWFTGILSTFLFYFYYKRQS